MLGAVGQLEGDGVGNEVARGDGARVQRGGADGRLACPVSCGRAAPWGLLQGEGAESGVSASLWNRSEGRYR